MRGSCMIPLRRADCERAVNARTGTAIAAASPAIQTCLGRGLIPQSMSVSDAIDTASTYERQPRDRHRFFDEEIVPCPGVGFFWKDQPV